MYKLYLHDNNIFSELFHKRKYISKIYCKIPSLSVSGCLLQNLLFYNLVTFYPQHENILKLINYLISKIYQI